MKRTEAMVKLQEVTGLDPAGGHADALGHLLPALHLDSLRLIGVVAAISLYLFGRQAKKWHDMNA